MNKKLLAVAVALFSGSVMASGPAPDSRTSAMGGAGTATADYLTASFYNPALVAVYHKSDDVGILLPNIAFEARDPDNMLENIEDFQDAYDNQDAFQSVEELSKIQGKNLYFGGNLGMAVAVPNSLLPVSFFANGYLEAAAITDIHDDDLDPANYDFNNGLKSSATLVTAGVLDIGLTVAKQLNLLGQQVVVGVSPKIQQLHTYNYTVFLNDFETEDFGEDRYATEESGFNLDLGAAWVSGPFQVGFAAKNMISNTIDTIKIDTLDGVEGRRYTYEIAPQYTVGAGVVFDMFTAGIDLDLNKKEGFKNDVVKDDTQMLRIGAEIDAFNTLQLRAGYKKDLEETLPDTFTAGVGLSPFNAINLDVAASYSEGSSYGIGAQLAFTF